MKKLLVLTILLVAISALQSASAQTRIQFAKGRSSAVVKGSTGVDGVYYVLRARSGQKIVLTLTPTANIGIKVETEGSDGHEVLLREERGGTYEVGLESDGEYTIFVGSLNHRSVSFTLTVKITKLADI